MSTKKTVWQSDDGTTFSSKAEADQHELDLLVANEIMEQLGFNSHTADKVARNFKEIARIVKHVEKNQKGTSKQEDSYQI